MSQPISSTSTITIKVLHVDDEPFQLDFVKTFLASIDSSIDVESASSPTDALKRLVEEDFDCIVSDYQMPDMDGIVLARKIRETSDIPFIIYTGRGSEDVAEAAFTVGIDDYIRKETNPSHYQVLARSIRTAVEKHRAEIALLESEEKYRSLVQNSMDGIMVFTGRKFMNANQQAAVLHGCNSVEELTDSGPSNLLHPQDRDRIKERSLARQRGEDVSPITEFRLIQPNGTVKIIQSSSSTIQYAGKTSTLAFLRDITERKRIEDEFQEREERLRAFMGSATDGFVLFDARLKYVDVNRATL